MKSIVVKDLAKRYSNGTEAVKGISFELEKGEIFGMVGPNGAGKTTTIKMITTLTTITSGDAFVSGIDVKKHPEKVRRIIGMVPQDLSVDDDLHGFENLVLSGKLYGMDTKLAVKKANMLLDFFDLTEFKDKDVGSYSGGMKKRLDLASGLMHEPEVLFLDEPTLGLDTQTRSKIWDYVKRLNKELNMTILVTTHYLEEADMLCNRIAIVDFGKIVALDKPSALKEGIGNSVMMVKVKNDLEKTKKLIENIDGVGEITMYKEDLKVTLKRMEVAPAILETMYSNKITLERLSIKEPSLDDVFIHYTGAALRDREEKTDSMAMRRTMRRMRQ